jgi:c-di-GMP-binding flagellar brake protein YcgR
MPRINIDNTINMENTRAGERREHERRAISKGCKLFHWGSRRYLSARVCDVSVGGALLRVESPRRITMDEQVDVLISWDDRALVRSADEINATIVRANETATGEWVVAVRFAREAQLAAAA